MAYSVEKPLPVAWLDKKTSYAIICHSWDSYPDLQHNMTISKKVQDSISHEAIEAGLDHIG